MDATDADALVAEILADPSLEGPLARLHRLAEESPAEGAAVLEQLAASASDHRPELASRWLTEAAALWSGVSGASADPRRAARALRVAVEISPGDDAAAARLTQLYRENGKHRAL